jgi:peptidoglycan/xylan/chitin deacetylase (PgdA/CDA1 family)
MQRVAILSYHKVGLPAPGGWETWYYVPERTFEEQLRLLRDLGYGFIDLPALYRGLEDPSSLPEKSALITFDDGYRNNLTSALPIMRKLAAPGVVFVPTQFVGCDNAWDYLKGSEPREPLCTWEELRELERGGVMVESHGASHPSFSDLTPEQQAAELCESKAALERGLGRPAEFFAYPYGDAGRDAALSERLLKEAGYRAACLYGGGLVSLPGADRFRLERLAMGPDSDLAVMLGEQ